MLLLVAVAAGCRADDASPSTPSSGAPMASTGSAASPLNDPQSMLDELDERAPVPLLPMMANHQKETMRDHLVAVQEIVVGMSAQDFDAIEQSAKRLGTSAEMGSMCERMGAGAPGFTEQGLAFHRTADEIGDAARSHDMPRVASALGATLKTCTSCHASFKQHVVDDDGAPAADGPSVGSTLPR